MISPPIFPGGRADIVVTPAGEAPLITTGITLDDQAVTIETERKWVERDGTQYMQTRFVITTDWKETTQHG